MPPKAKYTREEMTEIAYELVRAQGKEALHARSLATALGTSTAPIFTAFDTIEELQQAVLEKAKEKYREYLQRGLSAELPFKGAGLQYIRFAKEEPNLFKLLFMGAGDDKTVSHYMPAHDENEPLVRGTVEQAYGMSEEQAKRLYNHLSVYVHGIAVMYAQGGCVFTDEDVSNMLSEVFKALIGGKSL